MKSQNRLAYFPLFVGALKAYDITTAFIGCYEFARWSNPETPLKYRRPIYATFYSCSRSTYNRKKPINKGFSACCCGEYIPIYYGLGDIFEHVIDLVLYCFIVYRLSGTNIPFLIARKGDTFGDFRTLAPCTDKQYNSGIKRLTDKGYISGFYTQTNKGLERNIMLIEDITDLIKIIRD